MPHCRTNGKGLTCGRGLRPTAPPPGGEYRPPSCRAAASLEAQNANKNKFYLHSGPYRPAAGRQGAGRPAAGR